MADNMPFRLRGREVTRVEAFSDVVFGFALTLIVVSLEVPTRFEELMQTMRGFLAFAICFAILTWVWHEHHTFFRRYALTDEITIALNTGLLFLVLFYVYPLKFMFSVVTGQIRGTQGNAPVLFTIYGLGFAGIFAVFLLLYVHVWRRRDDLELNVLERHDTKTKMLMYASYIGIGLLSTLLANTFSGRALFWAGWSYFLLGPVSAFIGFQRGTMRGKMVEALRNQAAIPAQATSSTPVEQTEAEIRRSEIAAGQNTNGGAVAPVA